MNNEKRGIWDYLEDLPIVNKIIDFMGSRVLPGFQGVTLGSVSKFVYTECMRNDIIMRANSVAFSIFVSLFPTIIFIFTLLPMFPISADYLGILKDSTKEIFPSSAHEYIFTMINDVVSIKRSGLLSLGFFLALFFSSTGMMDLMNGFEKSYEHAFKKRKYFKKRAIAFLLVLAHATLTFVTLSLLFFGQVWLLQFMGHERLGWLIQIVFLVAKWLVMLSLVYIGITSIYRYGPSLKERVAWINPGSILATILTILISYLFSLFINNFGRYNEIYGSIGALLVFLLWLEINALIILIGFELNAGIAVNKVESTRQVDVEKIFESTT